ncbi:Tetratricopeptide repeat protein 21B [Trichoplax sp. H2]|nr:Tetratricopeptide repeat protein 21B [Trichoplax sp. H2]|eukprot:RDD45285.1 Tetratricopeptide repeat protein 21B [Trichoplax sp. H2]
MASGDTYTLALINFYCREKLYNHVCKVATDAMKKYGNDNILHFWHAFGLIMQNRVSEGMRELQEIEDDKNVVLCTILCLVYAHKKSKLVDRESVQQLDARLKTERQNCSDKALYFAAMYLWHMNRNDKAREYIDRMLKISNGASEGLILRGWIDITSDKEQYVKKAQKYFEEALNRSESSTEIDALLGKAKCFELKHNYTNSVELINRTIAAYPKYTPALIEKARMQLALQEWDQAVDTSRRTLIQDSDNIAATNVLVLHSLCRIGDYTQAVDNLGELILRIDKNEPKNAELYYKCAVTFSRLCGRQLQVIHQTYTLTERAMTLAKNNSKYTTEVGNQLLLMGKTKEAMNYFSKALTLDGTSVPALIGIIKCQIAENQFDEAKQQLELLQEVQQSIGKVAEVPYLSAVMAHKINSDIEKVTGMLNSAVDIHFSSLGRLPLGMEYYMKLNPDFIIQIAKMYLAIGPSEPDTFTQRIPVSLRRCGSTLDPISKGLPGLRDGHYLLAKVKYYSGAFDAAQATLQICLDNDQTFSEGHLLMAQINAYQGKFNLANQALDMALSYNFEIRDSPSYHLIKARILKKNNEYEEALKILKTAMNVSGVRKSDSANKKSKAPPISISDRASIFLELVEVHITLKQQPEAAKVMQDALHEFANTSEESRLNIANADLALGRGDIDQALSILRSITPSHPFYVKARERMADIYLNYRKDKRLYASCYRELAEQEANPQTYLLLGDAYMSIQEPEKAIDAFEAALRKNPHDASLVSKIGQALFKTHQYIKAVNYYETAIKSNNQTSLRMELAELYLKLKQYEKAVSTITAVVKQEKTSHDINSLMEEAKSVMLLAQIYERVNMPKQSLEALHKCLDAQEKILKRVGVEQPEAREKQREIAAKICCDIANHLANERNTEDAISFYKKALSYCNDHMESRLSLAKLYLQRNEIDFCQKECTTMLQIDDENVEAAMMKADILFIKGDFETATFQFQKLLDRVPNQFSALVRLTDLLRREGKLEDCLPYLEQAESACLNSSIDPGYNYCRGLYERHMNNPSAAMKHFNLARKDSEWGEKAVFAMVEICLNPDNETLGGETLEAVNEADGNKQSSALKTANKLLKELKPKSAPSKKQLDLLENYALISTKQKQSVEKALSSFISMLSEDQTNITALLGTATAYMFLKQVPKARNQLKKIAKLEWNSANAEDFERSWLLLADVYIQSGKYDNATELLRHCLKHNKSCSKACEYMGHIMEKEQAYKDASDYYEFAWKFTNQSNPAIGFKLAFNYLKAKRFVDAINICHKVLADNPEYPKIKKEILDKARNNLRT